MPSRINPYTGEVVLTELPSGLAFAGRTNSDMTPSKTAVVCAQLAGYGDDYFNNHFYMQVLHASHELLTIDGAPAPADFAAAATLTGSTSLKTCVVVAKLTSLTYIVKSRSGAFTDGEVISDGTNSVDCGAGFPTFAAAAAPEHEVRKITDYVSLTGTFTVDAFTQVVGVLDEILALHESLVSLGRNDADNVFDSSTVTKNRDGSLLERTEFIIDAIAGPQFRTEQSHSGTVEENAFEMFNISLFDLNSGAIASADINIAAITQTMEKSTGGADFSNAGITQPAFVKADGRVYCSYQFLAAQWAVGDLYRLTVTGITAVVDTETVYAPTMVWSNAVLEAAAIDTNVETILAELAGGAGVASFPSAANPGDGVSLAEVIRAILTSIVGGDDYDGYTNISNTANASLNAIAQKFAATLGIDGANLFSSTIQGSARSTIEAVIDAMASYIVASGAAWSAKVNNSGAALTNLYDALNAFFTVMGIDGVNEWSTSINGATQTTVEATEQAIGASVEHLYTLDDRPAALEYPSSVVDESILAFLMSKSASPSAASFSNLTDSLEALSDKTGAFSGDGGADYDDSLLSGLKTLSKYIADGDGDFATGSVLPANKSLYDGISGGIDAVNRAAGKFQSAITTESLDQIAGTYDLFTGTTQPVKLMGLSVKMPTGAAGGALTSISIQTDDATPGVIISAANGAVANLTSEAEIGWSFPDCGMLINVGTKIQLTIAGGAHGGAYDVTVIAHCRAVVSGGYLAVSP